MELYQFDERKMFANFYQSIRKHPKGYRSSIEFLVKLIKQLYSANS